MAYLHDFDYIFAIAMIFAFLDAYNIGANDVANSFASSVSSRSLKYWQAMVLATLCEFLGASLVGSRVSDTIRSKIINVDVFEEDPAVLMLTMACALVGSSIWLTIATCVSMPVSTTHSIVGATIGAGIAAKGAKNVHWGWDGVAQIFASWAIAPAIAGAFSAIVFLFSKYAVLEIKDVHRSISNALILVPVLVFACFAILTMLIVWKGAPSLGLSKLSNGAIAGSICGVGAVAFILYMTFLYPYYRRKLLHNDWTLKWYDIFRGPIYWFKSTDDISPMPENHELTIDYYKGRRYEKEDGQESTSDDGSDIEKATEEVVLEKQTASSIEVHDEVKKDPKNGMSTRQYWWSLIKQGPRQWPKVIWLFLIHGVDQDIISAQTTNGGILAGNLKSVHVNSKYYDNRVEYLFSLLQAITAGTMSFTHGANDIANAAGPLSTVYLVWTSNTVAKKSDVPVWVLCYTAAALVIGLLTFGYRIMSSLGNKLILQSPSRGFSIELGAAITVVMATQLAIPVSTTQCAVGATVFVGLCNKDLRSVNWRMVAWIYLGWIFTLPVAGIIAGILNGIILNAPRFGGVYELS